MYTVLRIVVMILKLVTECFNCLMETYVTTEMELLSLVRNASDHIETDYFGQFPAGNMEN